MRQNFFPSAQECSGRAGAPQGRWLPVAETSSNFTPNAGRITASIFGGVYSLNAEKIVDSELSAALGTETGNLPHTCTSTHLPGVHCHPFPSSRVHVNSLYTNPVELVSIDCDPAVIRFGPSCTGEARGRTDICLLSGMAHVRYSGQETEIHAGNVIAVDDGTHFAIEAFTQCRLLVLRPTRPTPSVLKDDAQGYLDVIDMERHLDGKMALSFLMTVTNEIKRVKGDARAPFENIVMVLTVTLNRIIESEMSKRRALWQDSLLLRLKDSVEKQLSIGEIRPATLAAEHHISVRQVHRIFSHTGETLMQYVKRRRLDGFAGDLRDPALDHLKISEVAAKWGMLDAAMLSKQFRAAYRMPPREYRKLYRAE